MRILDSLLHHHDFGLVLLAACICAFGVIATMSVVARAEQAQRATQWIALVSVCAGATVWATHFIAMLAYRADIAATYAPGLTIASFVVGTAVMGAGFLLAIRRRTSRTARTAGGALLGVGVVALHYTGMAALRMPGTLHFDADLVALSVLCSALFGAAALRIGVGATRPQARLGGAALMVAMIVTLHFVGMGAVHLDVGAAAGRSGGGVTRTILAVAASISTVSVLFIGIAGVLVDQRVSHRLAAEADRFRALANGAFEGLIVHVDGIIVDANPAARAMLGLPEHDGGTSIGHWYAIAPDLAGQPAAPAADGDASERLLWRADGSRFPAEICRRTMRLPDGSVGEICAIRDLTARKEAEAHIAHLALHDPLTELPNRRFFIELASKAVSHAQRSGEGFALIAVDVDDFKRVNDVHGHAAGDALISVIARRIAATVREVDVAARFGGDEFVILQAAAGQPKQAIALAERLLDVLPAPIRLEAAEVTVSVSIGVALYPEDGETVDALLRNADVAMYRAKADGKATCRFFEAQMDAALMARRTLENGLRRAVAEERLCVVYQPIVDSATRRPLGFEALVRWPDAGLGIVMPGDFIPVAEDTGLIVPIGRFVLRQACRDAMDWPAPLRVAVNLSAVQFRRKGLVDMVREALAESGLPGDRLELEVTETLLLDNRMEALRTLTELKTLGVRIAMDDFGTGYSSLSYLHSFPFDKIKIDRVFLDGLPGDSQNAAIVRAVAALGRSLHMTVVAEGVETELQAEMLQGIDCDELQGFLIARPMAASAVGRFLGTCTAAAPERAATGA